MVNQTTTKAGPLKDLTGFQRDVLTAVAALGGESSGQAVKDELERHYGDVHHGRLYPNLDDLVEAGYIEKGELDRRTNSHTITDAGREALRANAEHQLRSLE